LILYIGGGITHDSIPEDEWEETEIKADTLLSVLKQIK
jgi:isochorismate synthase